jgi:molybdate transport system ATP-binding protein
VLRAVLVKKLGEFQLDVTLEVPRGTTLVVVGENGAGKTTILRLLAGLDHPDQGSIVVGSDAWFDGQTYQTRHPWDREVGWAPQDYTLFPHMNVFRNVAFGLRTQGLGGRWLHNRVEEILDRLQIRDLAKRKPRELSGGQRQRVSLARALVHEPALVLLDEPLSALDTTSRRALRTDLRKALAELRCTTVFVTHAPQEATLFGDRILVLEAGRTTQSGTREELLRYPKSSYVAEFVGVNLFHGRISYRDFAGLVEVDTEQHALSVVDPGGDGEVFVAVSPRDITLHLEKPQGSAHNVFQGQIQELVPEPPFGERVRVAVATEPPLVAEVTRHSAEIMKLAPGLSVYASFKATSATTYR